MTHEILKPMLTSILSAICRRTPGFQLIYEYEREPELYITGIAPEDEGRLIGRKGGTFWSLTVAHYYACKSAGMPQVRIHELETHSTKTANVVAFRPREDWERDPIKEMIGQLVRCTTMDNGAWVLDETGGVVVRIRIPAYMQKEMTDPNLAEALDIIIHAAGKSCGASIKTEVEFK